MSKISDLAKSLGNIPVQLVKFCEVHEKSAAECEAIFKQFLAQGFYREGANGWGEAPANNTTPGESTPTDPPSPPATEPVQGETTMAVTTKLFVNGVEQS